MDKSKLLRRTGIWGSILGMVVWSQGVYGQSVRLRDEGDIAQPRATVVGGFNSLINDEDGELIYVLPINYQLPKASKWLELRPPSIIRFNSEDTELELEEPIGISLFGKKGNYNLKVSLFFRGKLKSGCHKVFIAESVKENLIDITINNRWHPLLFCNSKQPKPVEGIYRVLNANLPGKYKIQVNGRKLGEVEYTLESNSIVLNFYDKEYKIDGITQILLFTPIDNPNQSKTFE